MSTTQELIERLREAEQTLADYEREGKAGGWVMSADLARVTFDRLASLSAELAALKARLAGVVRFAEHIAKQPLSEQCRKDHEDEGHDGEPDFEGAYDAIIEQARAAIAAYLAAVRDGE